EFHHAGERVSVSGAVSLFDLGAVLLPCPPAKVYESPFREVEVRDRDLVEIDGLDPERHYAVLAEVEGFARVWLFGLLPRALAYEVELEEEGRLEGVVHGDGARLEGATLTLREDDG